MNTQLKYVGSWQHGSTVLQQLDGPIGDGTILMEIALKAIFT